MSEHSEDCSDYLERIVFFLDNELDEADCSEVQVHLDECGPCLEKYDLQAPATWDELKAACDKIKAAGGNVTREAGPVKGGSTVIAFVTDPDGYKIELIQRAEGAAGGGLR